LPILLRRCAYGLHQLKNWRRSVYATALFVSHGVGRIYDAPGKKEANDILKAFPKPHDVEKHTSKNWLRRFHNFEQTNPYAKNLAPPICCNGNFITFSSYRFQYGIKKDNRYSYTTFLLAEGSVIDADRTNFLLRKGLKKIETSR